MARARRGGQKKIDFVEWSGTSGATLTLASSGANFAEVVSSTTAATLLRTRGEVIASIDGPVDNDQAAVSCGITVITEEQLAAGITSIPNPSSDLDADWLWHGFLLLMAQAGTGVGASLNVNNVTQRLTIDSKAMRRIRPTMSLAFVAHNVALGGTPAVDLLFAVRCLKGV